MRLSLRMQLSLWFGLIMLIIMFVTTFIAQQATTWNIERSFDDALQKRGNMVAAIISSDITTDEASYVQVMNELAKQEFPFVPLLLRIINPRGHVVIEYGMVTDPIVKKLDGLLLLPGLDGGRFDSIGLEGVEPLRVYTVAVSHPQTHEALATVQAVEALGQLNQATQRLWRNSIIAALMGGALAIIAGLFLIQRGFRPLRHMLRAIDEVDYDHLKNRLQKENRPFELEELAKSLTAMWQRLDTAISTKQKVTGSVSHDLRTPLTALQGQLEVLLLQPSLNRETKSSLERMLSETRRLIRMVKNLLLTTQLEANPILAKDEVNLKELLDEIIGDVWVLAKRIKFDVKAPADVKVTGDRDLLKQMLLNIVDNAIKFTPTNGTIRLILSKDNGWAVLEITDTGRGIPKEQLPHVMEAFYKADTSRRASNEGARLGLAIVKQIAELHGCNVEIESHEGIGTSVKVSLPIEGSKGVL